MKNPYIGLPNHCFWPRIMANSTSWMLNPVTKSETISKHQKVSTMGSCFAQHIAKHITKVGLNYYVTENAPEYMSEEDAKSQNYGIFSARFGNVYTVKQALQLFQRAFDTFVPLETAWKKGSKFIDPFRPQIQAQGFQSEEELISDRVSHLRCVKDMFLNSDWIVFTLGLTEAWKNKSDGSILPLAPGINGGTYDTNKYEFVNFDIDAVRKDLFELILLATETNPKVKFLLTLSPVPLNATYENKHVLCSTTYSKSVLRVAIEESERKFNNVTYFPSYEIFTSSSTGGAYFGNDFREVLDIGVQHAMRVFSEHFTDNAPSIKAEGDEVSTPQRSIQLKSDIVCDEDILGEIE